MSRLTIFANSTEIDVDNKPSGYRVSQGNGGTIVSKGGVRLSLPSKVYALSCDEASLAGNPGFKQFERDFLAATGL